MKIARFFAFLFGALGFVLLVGSVLLCLVSVNAPVRMEEIPAGAVKCGDALEKAIAQGDMAGAGDLLYGQPELNAEYTPADALSALVWEQFRGSIGFAYSGDFYVSGSKICRDATVTALNVESVTANLKEHARSLMTARVEAATEMSELYDESNEFRQDLVDAVLREAVETALAQDAQTVSRKVTIRFVCQDGQWWALADDALLDALSGGLG